jgi:hypothetical protein
MLETGGVSLTYPAFLRNSHGLFGPKRGEVIPWSDGELPDVYMSLRAGGCSCKQCSQHFVEESC